MTTYYDFAPSQSQAFQFQPTLDGETYSVIVTWNLYGQRYYVNIYSLAGDLVVSLPLIGSPIGLNIQALSWAHGTAFLTTVLSHGFKIGSTVTLTVTGSSPGPYDGTYQMLIEDGFSMSYALANDPGEAAVLGTVSYGISMTGGYFTSTLIYREAARQFEVSP